ncbi:uncharacterized protein B0I36DRAFT_364865 [Microdochium trichocladiopsis]|uniref:BRCT domain-containing protein n=1 Tax=Microdochium trichocladiopsis TaxID=1682393 RepID=A0A9P8Y2J6_9PEZI|nr:uncharacterized protein B0I36DRAFT_364865 [Microdochium trichocladiopsis]KAH7027694.1 hypothetical protein B0I36DRAFT_364865 [Microdochium trichocladiopsis]
MEVASPPKRMTRARGARVVPALSQTKILNKPSAAVAARTSAKRKTRPDDTEDELQQTDSEQPKTMNRVPRLRTRARKTAEAEASTVVEPAPAEITTATTTASTSAATAKPAARTRTRKVVAASATQPAKAPEPAPRTTRTRVRKPATTDEQSDNEALAAPGHTPKKATRKRAVSTTKQPEVGTITTLVPTTNPTPGLKSNFSRPASRLGGTTKKSVSFEEPEKENMVPVATTTTTKAKTAEPKAATATGMRARPVRKTTTVPARTTRTSTRTAPATAKKPLSPKKDGANRPLSRCDESSDDELATHEKTPMKPLMKSPVKPPASLRRPEHKLSEDENAFAPSENIMTASVMRSPARRPPASPWKESMKSPAKKIESVPFDLSGSTAEGEAPTSPSKTSMLQSPAKRPQVPIKAFQMSSNEGPLAPHSPVKRSLFGSPAKRGAGAPFKSLSHEPLGLAKKRETPVKESSPVEETGPALPEQILEVIEVQQGELEVRDEEEADSSSLDHIALDQQIELELSTQLAFPGRLSAVLPRHADPALKEKPAHAPSDAHTEEAVQAAIEQKPLVESTPEDPMDLDEMNTDEAITTGQPGRARSLSPMKAVTNPMFRLRAKDLDDQYMSESEDELATSGKTGSKFQDTTTVDFDNVPATPTPAAIRTPRSGLPSSAAKAASRAIRSVSRGTKHGFTPLAAQFSDWRASSPSKLKQQQKAPASPATTDEDLSLVSDDSSPRAQGSPANGHFFEDEMKIRADMEMEAMIEADLAAGYSDDSMLDDMMDITNEDVELAAEANEMSLMDDAEVKAKTSGISQDDTASEASQEYGDENAVPIDPALMNADNAQSTPVTPARPVMRTFHTTSKVPLKPADDTPPARNQARSFSASKAGPKRPEMPARNATVISYSPTKEQTMEEGELAQPVTPGKADSWSMVGTPARTPRRDLNTDLLRGAVVFVDVHTSEGADASAVFVELLTQMGARCVKTWTWNPSHDGTGESKIGITHVVYKDGGKRTMEKVRESNGVVQCVGVGWVLDCEKHNQWVDESTHYIDTSLIPRGGRNRRKSMEPKALANVNGALVTPMKNNAAAPRECMTAPSNQMNRRESSLWMRSPSDMDEDEDAPGEADDWRPDVSSILTPVPKTPAPEAVARYAMDVTPGSSSADDDSSIGREPLHMQTCPPKQSTMYSMGANILGHRKDETVMMRLMAARRKSLQFAPKVASPLSKAWY